MSSSSTGLSIPTGPSSSASVTPLPSRPQTPISTLPPASTISLPRILCLHGGGVNASIFKNQLRAVLAHPSLVARFRFVFVDAPFLCDEGIGVYPVYKDWGPFRRWSRWLSTHETVDAGECVEKILGCVAAAMGGDPGTGEWVGVLGFSQGAKVGCSLLLRQQLIADTEGGDGTGSVLDRARFRFGVIMAGRAPLLALSEQMEEMRFLQGAAGLPDEADMDAIYDAPECKLRLPTVHVHGLKDEGLELHRRCVADYCAAGTTNVVEWDGPHRIPIKRSDVEKVVEAIVEMADEYGV